MVFRRSVSDLNIALTLGNSESGNSESALPLDNISAVLAFSAARKLRTAYTGDAIRVRESSGDTEADIGFDGSGNLDEAALLSHCGSNDGFIVKIYDQSGDANAVDYEQSTASLQPQIVSSGSVIKKNGKPAMQRVTSGAGAEYVTLTSWNTRPSDATYLGVTYPGESTANSITLSAPSGSRFIGSAVDGSADTLVSQNAGTPTFFANGSNIGTQGSITRDEWHSAIMIGELLVEKIADIDFSNASFANLRTEYTADTGGDGHEFICEHIFLSAPSSGDESLIESNQANYYGITLS